MIKRRGYKDSAAQVAANKRAEEKNPALKEKNKISRLKSSCKRYIRVFANVEDLNEIKILIKEREDDLK